MRTRQKKCIHHTPTADLKLIAVFSHESQNVFSKPILFRANSKSRCLRTFRSPATQHPDRPEHGLQRDPQACTAFVLAILMSLVRWATVCQQALRLLQRTWLSYSSRTGECRGLGVSRTSFFQLVHGRGSCRFLPAGPLPKVAAQKLRISAADGLHTFMGRCPIHTIYPQALRCRRFITRYGGCHCVLTRASISVFYKASRQIVGDSFYRG